MKRLKNVNGGGLTGLTLRDFALPPGQADPGYGVSTVRAELLGSLLEGLRTYGYVATRVHSYWEDGDDYFVVVYRPGAGLRWEYVVGFDRESYAEAAVAMRGSGLHPLFAEATMSHGITTFYAGFVSELLPLDI